MEAVMRLWRWTQIRWAWWSDGWLFHPSCKEHPLFNFVIGLGGHGPRFWLLGTSRIYGGYHPKSIPDARKEHVFQVEIWFPSWYIFSKLIYLLKVEILCAGSIWSGGFWWGSDEHQQPTKNSFLFRWIFMKYTKINLDADEFISPMVKHSISGPLILFKSFLLCSKIITRCS